MFQSSSVGPLLPFENSNATFSHVEGVLLNPNCSCSHSLGNYCSPGASYRAYVIQDISLSGTYDCCNITES